MQDITPETRPSPEQLGIPSAESETDEIKGERRDRMIKMIQEFDFEGIIEMFNEAMKGFETDPGDDIERGAEAGLPTIDAEKCLRDEYRTRQFKEAIEQVVKKGDVVAEANVHPGDVVVEAGAGTGILALMAAARGAKKVYAIEINKKTVDICKRFVEYCGFGDAVEVMHADAKVVDLSDKRFDVLISENMYTGLLVEDQMQIINWLKQWKKEGGRIIPERFQSFVELAIAPEIEGRSKVRRELPEGIELASATVCIDDFYFETENDLELKKSFKIIATKSGKVNAINMSSITHLFGDTRIDRDKADFLCNDEVIYLDDPLEVEKDGEYNFYIRYVAGDDPGDVDVRIWHKEEGKE